jgi:hypothetical protein
MKGNNSLHNRNRNNKAHPADRGNEGSSPHLQMVAKKVMYKPQLQLQLAKLIKKIT